MNRQLARRIQFAQSIFLLGTVTVSTAHAQGMRPDSTVRLTLVDAIRLATQQNAVVQGAQARVEGARARVTQRRAELMPHLSAEIAERGSTLNSATFPIEIPSAPGEPHLFDPQGQILGPTNVFDARARVSQTLFDPTVRSRIETARTGVAAANADAANAADVAASQAANAYLAVLRADGVYSARLADSTLAAELVGIAQDQLRAGTGIALDLTRSRSQLAGARAQVIAARNERDRTRVELARVLGLTDYDIQLADSLSGPGLAAELDEAASIKLANQNRRDIQAVDLQAQASRQAASAIHNERLPSLGVFADEGQSQRNGRSFLPTYDWGIAVSLPIFDGNRRQGRVQEQLAQAQELDVRARDLRVQVAADVHTATSNLRSSAEQVGAARERLMFAEQELAQARERFQAGVAGNADVITASLTLNTARTQLVDALTSYQAARVGLARAQGTILRFQ